MKIVGKLHVESDYKIRYTIIIGLKSLISLATWEGVLVVMLMMFAGFIGKEEIGMGNAPHSMNIVSQKYDPSLDFHVTMYDNLPYKRDADYCNAEKIALYSGKIIKYYLCMNQTEGKLIDNKDSEIEQILANIKLEEQSRIVHREPEVVNNTDNSGVTPEQIRTLLDDQGIPLDETISGTDDDENDIDASEDSINAFSDVEDW